MLNQRIHVKTTSRLGECEYSGLCVVHNDAVVMLLNFNGDTLEYDGFTIFRNDDIAYYNEWDVEDHATLRNDNSQALLSEYDLSGYQSFNTALEQLNGKLIAMFTYDDLESYLVGKIESIDFDIISLKLISPDAEWLDVVEMDINTIWYLGFDTMYEVLLMKDAH